MNETKILADDVLMDLELNDVRPARICVMSTRPGRSSIRREPVGLDVPVAPEK
jgi:hypothetical protein